jgi:hypothetical protein
MIDILKRAKYMPSLLDTFVGWIKGKKNKQQTPKNSRLEVEFPRPFDNLESINSSSAASDQETGPLNRTQPPIFDLQENLEQAQLDELALQSSDPKLQGIAQMLAACDNILNFLDTQGSNPNLSNPEIAKIFLSKYGFTPAPDVLIDKNNQNTNDPSLPILDSSKDTNKESTNTTTKQKKPKPKLTLDLLDKKLSLIEQRFATSSSINNAKEMKEILLIFKQMLMLLQIQENENLALKLEKRLLPRVLNRLKQFNNTLKLNRVQRLLNKRIKLLRLKKTNRSNSQQFATGQLTEEPGFSNGLTNTESRLQQGALNNTLPANKLSLQTEALSKISQAWPVSGNEPILNALPTLTTERMQTNNIVEGNQLSKELTTTSTMTDPSKDLNQTISQKSILQVGNPTNNSTLSSRLSKTPVLRPRSLL